MELTETTKSKVCADIKAYILNEWKKETNNKKFAEMLSAEIEKATEDQFRFGDPPSYERGYVYGNITAKAYSYDNGTEYTRTVSVDMKTPEYVFFNIDGDNSEAVAMCEHVGKKLLAVYTAYPLYKPSKQKIYTLDDKEDALEDFAIVECKEQFKRIDFDLRECRVNDYDYVQTEPAETCPCYPVYFDYKDKKGNTLSMLIGYYDDAYEKFDYNIITPLTAAEMIGLWIVGILGVGGFLAFIIWISLFH